MKMQHKYTTLTFRKQKVHIDKDIAPMVSKMWKLGINTTNSCQAQCSFVCKHKVKVHPKNKHGTQFFETIETKSCNNNVWLAFESSADVELLYNIVAEYDNDDDHFNNGMYHKMSCDRFVQTAEAKYRHPVDGWAFGFLMSNTGVNYRHGYRKWGSTGSKILCRIPTGCKKNNFVIQPQITFPRAHMSYVESRLDLALNKLN